MGKKEELVAPRTYAVYGYLEYVATLRIGEAEVRLHFNRGSLTGYGSVPATMTTSNPALMKMIEQSVLFRNGTIRIYK